MKRRVLSLMTALSLLLMAVMPASATWDEEEDEELFAPGSSLVQGKDEEEKTETEGALDDLNQSNASNIGAMGQKDWAALAKAAANTGKWRDDFVAVAESQLGYEANADGISIYGDEEDEETSWTALFLRWAADKAGFGRHFPKGDTYDALLKAMKNIKAVKKISRSSYPAGGDIALIEKKGEKLFAVVIYVSNGYASLILADDNGKVTREVYQVSGKEFKQFIDLTVLMDRAGVDTGKGGDVPQIPAGGVAAWTNTNAVYMRSEPTTASKRVTTVKKSGTALIVTGAEKQQDGYIWYSVEYGKYRGYIRGDLLKLDQSALPTQAPAATFTPAPTAAPAATAEPGCALCAAAAGRYALPEECCYAHLLKMDEAARSRFMTSLHSGDPATFALFIDCHSAHTAAGDKAILCLGDACGENAWTVPGPAHAKDCPWHAAFAVQDRVVNIVIHQPASADGVMPGEQVTFTYEVYGAAAYQWYQVKTETAGDAVKETITLLPGETGTTLTVTAGSATDGLSYFCRATLSDFVTTVDSKPVSMDVREIVAAKAIVAEEVNFTYNYEGAAAYQWFVRAKGAAAYTAVDGAAQARLSLTAELAFSGAEYYCAAYDAKGAELGKSSIYTYEIPLYATYDVNSCVGHDLCKYVAELANMSREERYAVMTGAWADTAVNNTTLAELVQDHWAAMHAEVYPTLLCTCTNMKAADASHSAHCPWRTDAQTSANERAEADPCKDYAGLLPDGVLCAYEHLKGLGSHEARFAYITALQAEDPAAYQSYYAAYKAHGAHDLLCSCGQLTVAPGTAHVATCAWQLPVQTVANCVIGTELTLKPFTYLTDKTGYTFRWVDGEGNILAPAANPWELTVTAAYEAKTYRCDAILNNQVVSSQGFVIESQTGNLYEYVAHLWNFYAWEGDTEVLDKASVYAWMTDTWNIELADGTNLAENVLAYWAEAWQADSADLLCTCVLNGLKHSEHCLLAPDALHAVECPWAGEMTVVENTATGITVTGDIPEGVTLAVTAATGPMPEIDRRHFDTLYNSLLIIRYNISLMNPDGSEYVVPEGTSVWVNIPKAWLPDTKSPVVDVYHSKDSGEVVYLSSVWGEVILEEDGSVSFMTDGFSDFTVTSGTGSIGKVENGKTYTVDAVPGTKITLTVDWGERDTLSVTSTNSSVASGSFIGNKTFEIVVSENAALDSEAELTVVWGNRWSKLQAKVIVHIVSREAAEQAKLDAKFTSPSYPVYVAIRKDGKMPGEPSVAEGSDYVFFTNSYSARDNSKFSNDGDIPTKYIKKEILNHELFSYTAYDGSETIGLYDPTGVSNRAVTTDEIKWDKLLENAADEGITASDGTRVTASNYQNYMIVPYVIKCQEDYYGKGWHIDCAIVPKTAVQLSYNINIPAGLTINSSGVGVPNNETGVPDVTQFTIGAMAGLNNQKQITVSTIYTFTFVEWNTKPDGSGTAYQPGAKTTISENTTLYAIWSITPELGTGNLKVSKDVADEEADTTKSFTFSIAIPVKDDGTQGEYNYVLYGSNGLAITENGNVVGGKLSNGSTFTLKKDQYIIITGLPTSKDNSVVTVTETNANGYAPVWTGGTANGAAASIAIQDGKMSELLCTNTVVTISESELTVIKSGLSNGDSALVQVNVTHNNSTDTYLLALNANNNPQTITGLTVGATYTVTELNGWTWEYADTSAISGTIDADAKKNQVTVNNTKNTETWMHDESAIKNDFSNSSPNPLNNN